ncbi:MAG: hypothetical protein HYT46_02990 [Candidatus Vogelbacteria bacterium]|nr:hypothetical protein [Candidatus Vogelbacteria bacterium]
MTEPIIINPENLKSKRGGGWWIFVIIILVVIGAAWWFKSGGLWLGQTRTTADNYKAVFLTNDQVYFGKVSGLNKTYVTLSDIFYLQVAQPLQPSQPANNVNLIKLGSELHGPQDLMTINRGQILFIEDLKPDSQVVQAITRFKEQQSQGQ